MLKGILRQWKIWNLMHKQQLIMEEMIELHQARAYIDEREQSLKMMQIAVRKELDTFRV